MERSYILQKLYKELCKLLGQTISKSDLPDFNKEFSKSAKLLFSTVSRIMDIQIKFQKESEHVQNQLVHEKR